MHADSPGLLITFECVPSGKATTSCKKYYTNPKLLDKLILFPVRIKYMYLCHTNKCIYEGSNKSHEQIYFIMK